MALAEITSDTPAMKMRRPSSRPTPRIAPWVLARVAFVLLVVGGLLTLPALAHMSPPDPIWVPGIYDDADFDDVVVLAASAASGAGPAITTDARPAPIAAGAPPPEIAGAVLAPLLSHDPSRAPPLSA